MNKIINFLKKVNSTPELKKKLLFTADEEEKATKKKKLLFKNFLIYFKIYFNSADFFKVHSSQRDL